VTRGETLATIRVKPLSAIKPGDVIRHKSSCETAIVTAVSDVLATAWISCGFGSSIEIELCDELHEVIGSKGDDDPCLIDAEESAEDIAAVLANMITDDLLTISGTEEHGVRLNLVMSGGRLGGVYRHDDLVSLISTAVREYFSDKE